MYTNEIKNVLHVPLTHVTFTFPLICTVHVYIYVHVHVCISRSWKVSTLYEKEGLITRLVHVLHTVGVIKKFTFAIRTTAVVRMPVLFSTEELRTRIKDKVRPVRSVVFDRSVPVRSVEAH